MSGSISKAPVRVPQAGASACSEACSPILAAGSLRAVFESLAAGLQAAGQGVPALGFGASGLLYQRLLGGEPASLYASASARQPQALLTQGLAAWAAPFAANELALLCREDFAGHGLELLPCLLSPATRLGISTPVADPSGDYALELFRNIELRGGGPPGCAAQLQAKALQLTGGPRSRRPAGVPAACSIYAALLLKGLADVMVVYRSNAIAACQAQPALRWLELPAAWQVRAEYWLAVMKPARPAAEAFARALLAPQGQQLLQQHGFLSRSDDTE